ncbi:MAG TPA: DUF6138 family protein [Chitinolyticbacter sp.]|nr:DUF6138 family protein [Chitinolyticbacter sp.]
MTDRVTDDNLPDLQHTAAAIEASLRAQLAHRWAERWEPGRLQIGKDAMLKLRYRSAPNGGTTRCEVEIKTFNDPNPPACTPDLAVARLADGPYVRGAVTASQTEWLHALFAQLIARIARLHVDRSVVNYFDFSLYVWLDVRCGDQLQLSGRRMLIDEASRQALSAKQHAFDGSDLGRDPQAERTLSCFVGNLFDDLLAPPDYAALPARLHALDLQVASKRPLQERWQRSLNHALSRWVRRWLGNWFDIGAMGLVIDDYARNDQATIIATAEADLAMVAIARMLQGADHFMRDQVLTYLQALAQLDIAAAAAMIEHGSGTMAPGLQRLAAPWGSIEANDILGEIHIVLNEENAEGFAGALQQLIAILGSPFPRNYRLRYASRSLAHLPIAGLADSDTHHFFADALAHRELHPLLEHYARAAMSDFAWYTDVEAGEQSLQPSSYAVFGLALNSPQYAGLVAEYCDRVDSEHQVPTAQFVLALVRRYGLAADALSMLVDATLAASYIDDLSEQVQLYLQAGDRERLATYLGTQDLEDYEIEHVKFALLGGE